RPDARIITGPGPMGVEGADGVVEFPRATGARGTDAVVGFPRAEVEVAGTTAADTRAAVVALVEAGAELVLFAGGDGTARDVLDTHPGVPVLGIPAGVKVYSGCFAVSPATAGFLAAGFTGDTDEAEVVDLDEERYRRGPVSPRLYGTLTVPATRYGLSGRKAGSSGVTPATTEAIAREVVSRMLPNVRYILGPGATTMAVGRELGLVTTLLGVDVIESGRLVAADVSEGELVELVRGRKAAVVLSVIGGQGFVLGRGNQQISARVLKNHDLIVLATQQKLAALSGRPLLADSGDDELDRKLSGHVQVITGYRESTIYRIRAASEGNAA
ncbi:MAG: ATP-NAD kinase, partial [Nonomuraea sp.]|nr:ATP-NAD kinase [Nonomuraea sp.]